MLERRYQRLLRLYPARHRAVYGEEMLAVMLAGARPGQHFPGLRESVDVAVHAVAAWLPATGRTHNGGRWREAAAAAGVLLPMLFVAMRLHGLVGAGAWSRDRREHLVRLGEAAERAAAE